MDSKTVLISSLPAILFLTGIIFFSYSSLTLSKIITVQNEIFITFFKELKEVDLLSALIKSFEYLWTNVLWIILIFLLLMSFGFLVYLYYFNRVSFRIVLISQVAMVILALISTNFSIAMFLTSLSLIAGIMWMCKTFEPEKKAFSTGYSVVTSKVGLMSIFLSVGILVSLIVHIESYEEGMLQTNMDLIKNFMPDMSEAKAAQKKQVEQLTEGIKYSLSERYDYLPEETKTECKSLYDGLTQSMDSYKQQSFQKIDEQEMTISEEDIMNIFPFFGLIIKATPIIITISVYALLAILTPIMGIIGGFVYSIVKKEKD
jgi:hypothetical protein